MESKAKLQNKSMQESEIKNVLLRFVPRVSLTFLVHIVEHCNLNCRYCGHFSPIAEEEYLDIDEYKRDCVRLSELFNGEASNIQIMGGEPLLHPQVLDFLQITRECFPIGRVRLVTNGLLLPKMGDEFWKKCRDCKIEISVTEYPVAFDYGKWHQFADENNVKYTAYYAGTRTMRKFSVSLEDRLYHAEKAFSRCWLANSCITLRHGRMYTCATAAYADHLKCYFNLDLPLSNSNGIDIYTVNHKEELMQRLARPIPFCGFCDGGVSPECEWGISNKSRYEWLGFEFLPEDFEQLKKIQYIYVFGAGNRGKRTVNELKRFGIDVTKILVYRSKSGITMIDDIPVAEIDKIDIIEENSICLVALDDLDTKEEIYPHLSTKQFGYIVPVFGMGM